VRWMADCMPALHTFRGDLARSSQVLINCPLVWEGVFSSKKVLAVDFRHCQVLDPVGDAVAFPKSIEFWKDRRINGLYSTTLDPDTHRITQPQKLPSP
jgi:hypothetical protein